MSRIFTRKTRLELLPTMQERVQKWKLHVIIHMCNGYNDLVNTLPWVTLQRRINR